MKILFYIFGAPVTMYGLLAAASLLVLWAVSLLYLRREKGALRAAPLYLLFTAVGALLISRLVFVLGNAAYYIDELDGYWLPALYFWDGGYSMIGYILGVFLGALLCARVTRASGKAMVNAAGIGLPASIVVLRLGEFFSECEESGDIGEGKYLEGFGIDGLLSRLGLLMQADGDMVYPACLAEALAVLVIFVCMLIWIHREKQRNDTPDVLLVFFLLYGCAQIVLEQLRDDGHMVFHFVHIQQVLALGLVLTSVVCWSLRGLRRSISMNRMMVVWGLCLICIGLAVLACFGVDRWANKLLAWSMLILPTLLIAVECLVLRRKVRAREVS